jgi:GR25 family glycosyltransferase involved in LPS biosynthesis
MKAFVITIQGHAYSEAVSKRCIKSAKKYHIDVEPFWAVTKDNVAQLMLEENLRWSWANMNKEKTRCPYTSLEQFPYRTKSLEAKMACSMSHYLLWKRCVELDEDVLILEHDAVFVAPLPSVVFQGAIQINDPSGGGYRGQDHSKIMQQRGTEGVHPLTRKRPSDSMIPDGFSGNSAYIVKPWAAYKFKQAFKNHGVWPNDATICLQQFPWLEELYPFVTVVKQTQSTSTE